MKTRFNTYDLVCSVTELQRLIGMRVNQIYDIDNRTYLIRLQRSEEKVVLLLESGNRIHTTAFEWPKNVAPSGFSMKMRKHLKNKRLESLKQLGVDRIVDMQFGTGEAGYHVILELYDRGNIVLTDNEMNILNILRPHTEGEKVRFAVKEKYPSDRARLTTMPPMEQIHECVLSGKTGEPLKKILNPHLEFGPAIIDHVLLQTGFPVNCKIGKNFDVANDFPKLVLALEAADKIFTEAIKSISKGYITQKKEARPSQDGKEDYIFANVEFHPMLFEQHKNLPFKEFESFDRAVDEFFSGLEGQKLDLKALQQEREAMKKLDNVRKDHDQRLVSLEKTQEMDKQKAELITRNQVLVDNAILAIQSALANQMAWPDIETLLKEAQARGDPVAAAIKHLKLESNHISLLLSDPYENSDQSDDDEPELKPMIIDVDLAHSAFGNARRYYDQKRSAAKKQQKTIESQGKALKSAEKKTKQALKEVQTIHSINKARKVYWFEKFYWFISSENYLIIGGRDQQQNELIVKRYLRQGDVYVHADLTGASSIVVKNSGTGPIPPKTLAEAGTMAVSYSVAWEAKVVAGAWWVNSDQVSKTAPTGEYLTTGSFMIRGKKNYLPPCQLVMGLGFLFRLEESSIERHKDERKVRTLEEDITSETNALSDHEIELESDSNDEEEDTATQKTQLLPIAEGESDVTEKLNDADKSRSDKQSDIIEKDSGSDSDEGPHFPNTQIKINLPGKTLKPHLNTTRDTKPQNKLTEQEENVIYLGDGKPVVLTNKQEKDGSKLDQEKKLPEKQDNKNEKESKQKDRELPKRGQKGKLKKIKEKYKDQDEEDRRRLMEALKPAGAAKEDKRKNKNKDPSGPKQQGKKKGTAYMPKVSTVNPYNEEDGEEDVGPAPEIDMLDQLTGKPIAEDELLFAVPIVAPYNTLINYKYKVKLTPGTGKRGKAAKTAVAMFLRDRGTTPREKDLLKAVKDEVMARNLPGKVKISAPQMQKLKK
ncbi:nuclear export mediator factor NEMF homolog isoform X1 [Neodiprion lecontei]|uniref:Nuclear export mediator factor NEMF homolog isoform X1 n=1 Tax=Neodiprion lecontei TaxID=441921 RepID=A0A6J0C6Q7_NEOLC|nr:nuclear export mediator factor NEMF homolog isoform X1 [Neodiprion lecontei]